MIVTNHLNIDTSVAHKKMFVSSHKFEKLILSITLGEGKQEHYLFDQAIYFS